MLAVGIELCGTSSLAFAVGVYIPMQYTTPIFLGGVVAWLVGVWKRKGKQQQDDAAAIAEAESSPGTLLASGYIAGGTLAAVAIAFMEFSPALKKALNYQETVVAYVSGKRLVSDSGLFGFGRRLLFVGARSSDEKERPRSS